MTALRQYSTDHRVLCSPSRQSLCSTASHWEKSLSQIQRTVISLIYFDIRWKHACLYLCTGVTMKQNQCRNWCTYLLMKLFENHQPRGHREGEPCRWHQSPERNNKQRLVLVKTKDVCLRPFFLFQDSSCELKMWRHGTLTFVSLVTDSLCVGLQRIVGGWGWE